MASPRREKATPPTEPTESLPSRFAKVSVTMPQEALDAARERAGDRGLSAYVAAAVGKQLRRDALLDWTRQMASEHGPVPEEDLRAARGVLLGEVE